MRLLLNETDRLRWERLVSVMERNDRILSLLAPYLNETPRLVTRRMVRDLARECEIPEESAYPVLLSAALGLNTDENAEDRLLEKTFLMPGLKRLDPREWRSDAYLQTVSLPVASAGRWRLCEESYAPYEPFVRDNPVRCADGTEIPSLGYFTEEFRFPAVLENGVEWMAVKPNEIATMREPIARSRGKVVTFGLGMGYYAFHTARKEDVTSVTVVERDPAVIGLFRQHLLPQFPDREKITVVEADAFAFAERELPGLHADTVFTDLWHDQSDGLALYLRMRRLERLSPDSSFLYWIEPVLLSSLRRMVWDALQSGDGQEIRTYGEAVALLSDESLRDLAPNLCRIDAD